MRLLRRGFVAAAVAWVAVMVLAPLALHGPEPKSFSFAFAYAAYAIGHLVCHQLPERSFHLAGVALPVCARCTGIYVAAAVAAVSAAARGLASAAKSPAEAGHNVRSAKTTRSILLVAAVPTMATLVYEWTTGDMPSHWTRAAAGAPLGAAVAWIIRDVN